MVLLKRFLSIILILLVSVSLVFAANASKLTQQEYSDLFVRAAKGNPEGNILGELEVAFLADPLEFITALAKEDYHTMFNVRFLTLNGADWGSDPARYAHRDALLRIAYSEKLTQSQRRVVSYMLSSTKILKNYVIYTDEIDYTELFSRVQEADTNSSSVIAQELLPVFDLNPTAFLQAVGELEDQETVRRVMDFLAYDHYYENYERENVRNAIQAAVESGVLTAEAVSFVEEFWVKVDQLVVTLGPLPTQPTTQPTIQPTTQPSTQPATQPTTQPTTQDQEQTPQSVGNYAPWVIAGVIVVALGTQLIVLVRNKKKG